MRATLLLAFISMTQAGLLASQDSLFAPGPDVNVGPGSGTVLLADVNGDGRLDMLTRHLQTHVVTIQLGNGQGGFAAAAGPMRFPYAPADMKLGDVNNDRMLDLVVTASDKDIVDVFFGNTRGEFSPLPGSPFTVTTAVDRLNKRTLHLVDLNEDGNLDVATANGRRLNTLGTLLGDGRGGFADGPPIRADSGHDAYWLAFGDLDGDGHLDLATASRATATDEGPGHLAIQFGDGKGAFRPAPWSPLPLPTGPRELAVGDVNGDRRPDIVIPHGTGLLSIFLNAGHRAFTTAPPFGDLMGDLVAATVEAVTVLLSDGRGFGPAPGSPFKAGPGAYNLAVGDVNGDRKLDIAASSFGGNTVTVLLGK